jgi:hypothetical protein
MHCGQSTPPNYRGEPEQTTLWQSIPFFLRRVWLARLGIEGEGSAVPDYIGRWIHAGA